jgi:hypothetical protein
MMTPSINDRKFASCCREKRFGPPFATLEDVQKKCVEFQEAGRLRYTVGTVAKSNSISKAVLCADLLHRRRFVTAACAGLPNQRRFGADSRHPRKSPS